MFKSRGATNYEKENNLFPFPPSSESDPSGLEKHITLNATRIFSHFSISVYLLQRRI